MSKRDLSAVGDVAGEVRAMLGTDDLSGASVDHVHRAIYDFLLPSDKTFLEGMAAARSLVKKPGRKPTPAFFEPERPEQADESNSSAMPAARAVVPVMASGSRRRAGNAADLVPA